MATMSNREAASISLWQYLCWDFKESFTTWDIGHRRSGLVIVLAHALVAFVTLLGFAASFSHYEVIINPTLLKGVGYVGSAYFGFLFLFLRHTGCGKRRN